MVRWTRKFTSVSRNWRCLRPDLGLEEGVGQKVAILRDDDDVETGEIDQVAGSANSGGRRWSAVEMAETKVGLPVIVAVWYGCVLAEGSE